VSTDEPVRIEILARENCESRGMAIAVVERVVRETGIPAEIEVVDVSSMAQAKEHGFLGSPTVRVGGRDVDQGGNSVTEVSLGDRVYRTGRGLAGWPEADWVRQAILLAAAGETTNGHH
jgi:hypothetical protein